MLPENLHLPDQLYCLFQTWASITHVLVGKGCSAHLLKTLSNIWTSGQVDEACIGVIWEHLSKISADTYLSAGRDVFQPANDFYRGVSLSSIKDKPDTVADDVTDVTDDETDEEADDSDVDNGFGVSPRLVSENASLSQYRSPTQAFADTIVTEELTLTYHGSPVVNSTALANIVLLQNPWSRASLPTPRSSSPLNPVSLEPPVAPATQVFAAGPDNSNLASGHECDTYREASPLSEPPRIYTQEQQVTSPRESVSDTDRSATSLDIVAQIQRIASPDGIPPLWHYLRAQRTSLPAMGADKKPAATELPDTVEGRIERLLSKYQIQYEMASNDVHFPELHRRLYLANIHSLYNQETVIRRQLPRQRKRRKATNRMKVAKRSLNDIFIDFLLPQLQKENDIRHNAKKRFENWMALGRICAKLVGSFGIGILLLIPRDLSNEILRALTVRQENALMIYLHQHNPDLKSNIQHLTLFLSQVVEEQRPPCMKLRLEELSENEIASGQRMTRSLKELLEYSDKVDYTSFLTEEALSQHSPPSTSKSPPSLTCLELASDDEMAFLDTQVREFPQQSIVHDVENVGDVEDLDDLLEKFFS